MCQLLVLKLTGQFSLCNLFALNFPVQSTAASCAVSGMIVQFFFQQKKKKDLPISKLDKHK